MLAAVSCPFCMSASELPWTEPSASRYKRETSCASAARSDGFDGESNTIRSWIFRLPPLPGSRKCAYAPLRGAESAATTAGEARTRRRHPPHAVRDDAHVARAGLDAELH